MDKYVGKKIGGRYTKVGDQMVWPSADLGNLEWLVRYGRDEDVIGNRFVLASVVAAYEDLVRRTQAQRNVICSALLQAENAALKQELRDYTMAANSEASYADEMREKNESLKRELEEARKNADRYLAIRTHDLIDEIVVAAFGRDPNGDADWQKSLDEWCDACIAFNAKQVIQQQASIPK